MWEAINKDPILKTVAIIILGVLGFGFAFNIMFGPNASGGEDMGGNNGYSMGNTLSYIYSLTFIILLVVLVVLAIMAIVRTIGKHLFKGGENTMFDAIKKDPILKGIVVVVLAVVVLGLLFPLVGNIFNYGGQSGMMGNGGYNNETMMGNGGYNNGTMMGNDRTTMWGGMMGNNGYATGNGYGTIRNSGYMVGFADLLSLLIKILIFVSIIGLAVGLVMFLKQRYGSDIASKLSGTGFNRVVAVTCAHCGNDVPSTSKYCPSCGKKPVEACAACGTELRQEWKYCPACAAERGTISDESTL